MTQTVHNIFFKLFLIITAGMISLVSTAQTAPELVFRNPVLESGTANSQGAVYRFSNVTTGVDALLKLKSFSCPSITMWDIDVSHLGWDKALQPQFGIAGGVQPNQNWYVDFEMSFCQTGTTNRQKMQKVVLTAIDIDGDGWSINEYANFMNANSTEYAPGSSLAGSSGAVLTLGANGKSTANFTCELDNISQLVQKCTNCGGTGTKAELVCDDCNGSGLVYEQCHHPYTRDNISRGPAHSYDNIDTSATQVMVTYTYLNKDRITFRYGAQSGAYSNDGSIFRLNSVWGKQFSLAPWTMLPVNFATFSVQYTKGDANINWQTSHEQELNHFTVQRSMDGKNYSDIATVFAGNTSNYSYKDKGVTSASGIVYYRILSVDKTKETQLSGVRTVRLTKNEMQTIALSTYPNPVASDLRITLPDAWQGKAVALQLYTANGIMAKSVHIGSAGQTETMALSNLAKGVYVVRAICSGETAQQRIVKN
jgi:hypothetical protein